MCWPSVVSFVLLPLVAVCQLSPGHDVTGDDLTVDRYTNLIQTRDKTTNETLKTFCILDYIYSKEETQHQKRSQFYDFVILDNLFGDNRFCLPSDTSSATVGKTGEDVTNKFVLINYSYDCDINNQINYFKLKSIYGLFIVIGCDVDIDNSINITGNTLQDNGFAVALIPESSIHSLSSGNLQLKLFDINFNESVGYGFDFSIVCIWLLATFTVCLGAFWSGTVRRNIFLMNKQNSDQTEKRKTRLN